MIVYEKTDFEAQKSKEDICPRIILYNYNIANFILGWSILHWNFFSWLRDTSDVYRFPRQHMVKVHFLLENL